MDQEKLRLALELLNNVSVNCSETTQNIEENIKGV